MVLAWAALAAAGCGAAARPAAAPAAGPRIIQPGAPGEASRLLAADDAARPAVSPADVAFMQGMIGHHAQALDMTALLRTRTSREDMRRLAARIDVSQTDEIRMMKAWLVARGQTVPDEHAHHRGGALMPGMLTEAAMAALAAEAGEAFDKLFLESMIAHHDGALTMVKDLLATPGAAQDSQVFAFAADVEADQSAEILRMRALRATMK
jgi:uncharacterized protein (DUF305 family)